MNLSRSLSICYLRRLCSSRAMHKHTLSAEYRSRDLWDERYCCKLLRGDDEFIKKINNKMIVGEKLDNVELDVFVNVATPEKKDTDQLEECVKLLNSLRRSPYANQLLPSTSHAICRLFLYSDRLATLLRIIENRIEFGIFPDNFALNLLFDAAIDQEDYLAASKLAVFVMLQEEFGEDEITDAFSLLAISKYIGGKTNFSDWDRFSSEHDKILGEFNSTSENDTNLKKENADGDGDEGAAGDNDDEEDDAQYVRIPFLRNPYTDNHFDLQNPRIVCAKTFEALGRLLSSRSEEQSVSCFYMGNILRGNWSGATELLMAAKSKNKKLNPLRSDEDITEFYLNPPSSMASPTEEEKAAILSLSNEILRSDKSLSQIAEDRLNDNIGELEAKAIREMKSNLNTWSDTRLESIDRKKKYSQRLKLIDEIRRKKEELKRKEQYYYFYDNLKKSSITRIQYD